MKSPTVTILIPVLNEAVFIEECLRGVLAFDLPDGISFEIIVLDGGSTDQTRAILSGIAQQDPRIRVLDNPGRIQSTALNIGIRAARGEFILRLDAHSFYPTDYLAECLATSRRTGAENVGGLFVTLARGDGWHAHLVQALTTHRFGVGNSSFRVEERECEADTVPYGFFPRVLFAELGCYDERLVRAQDFEINARIRAVGGRVWQNPRIRVLYHQQPDLISFLRKQFKYEAPYNAYLWYCAPYAFVWRHAITGCFSAGVLAGAVLSFLSHYAAVAYAITLALYFFLAVVSGLQQAFRYRRWYLAFLLPPTFFLYHFIHGLGVLVGVSLLSIGRAPVQRVREPWPGAGRRVGLLRTKLRRGAVGDARP